MQAALGHPFVIALPFAVGLLFWLIAIRERQIGRIQGLSFFQRNGTAVGLFLIVAVAFWAVFMIVLPQLFMVEMSFRPKLPPSAMGGPREAAEIINSAGKMVEKRVMPEITKLDKALAKQIESEMFKFEHLFVLDSQAMGALLREVESDVLIDALKGIEEDQRSVFFKAMSSRAADGIKDEIAGRGRLKMADVQAAQKAIVAVARRLAAEGTIVFGSGDDDYV